VSPNGTRRLRVAAPAKINFGLRIVGRRPDGYHLLESLFLPLDLADTLDLELAPAADARVTLVVEPGDDALSGRVAAGESNLAVRAARAFLERTGLAVAVALRLEKRVPVAAGLGGGSSDAGAVLAALARSFPGTVGAEALRELAVGLGADVPFFLDPRPALVSGVGERVEPLGRWPALALLLVNPGLPLATAEVYRAADALNAALTPPAAASTLRAQLEVAEAAQANRAEALASLLRNDLEPAAVRLCPPVARLRERLRDLGATAVGMSGSGATVFGVFRDPGEARAAHGRLAPEPPTWARVAITAKAG
jgi:4-diphosphocytidyl-2-C-methyl-D-erythritol kinase